MGNVRARNNLRRAYARVRELCMRVCVCRVQNLIRQNSEFIVPSSRGSSDHIYSVIDTIRFLWKVCAHMRVSYAMTLSTMSISWNKINLWLMQNLSCYMRLESAFSLPVSVPHPSSWFCASRLSVFHLTIREDNRANYPTFPHEWSIARFH